MKKNTIKTDNKIVFFREGGLHENGFKWYKTKFYIDKNRRIIPYNSHKVKAFEPNLNELVISIANLNVEKHNEIINFVNKYGLLGLIDFYKGSIENGVNLFGINDYNSLINNFPLRINPENPFFKMYYEPLDLFIKAILDFQNCCDIISSNFFIADETIYNDQHEAINTLKTKYWETELRWIEKYNVVNLTVVNNYGKPMFSCAVDSLLSAAFACLAWNTANGVIIKKCHAKYLRANDICGKFFWHNGKQKYCSKRCTDRMAQINRRKN